MAERERRRAPGPADYSSLRWVTSISAQLHEHLSCALPVTIIDLSLTGCRLWAGYQVGTDRRARLRVPQFAPINGQTVWARNGEAAMQFDRPLHPSVLHHLVGLGTEPEAARVSVGRR